MAVDIGASSLLGLCREAAIGTWLTPEYYIPILSEDLAVVQSNIYRRPIRGLVDPVGAVPGPTHVEGSITFEVTDTNLPYILYGMRGAVVQTGTGDLTYTFTPSAIGIPVAGRTLSFTLERNAIVFAYVGCVVGSLSITMQNGIMVATVGIVGQSEAVQAAPTEVWPTTIPTGIPGDMKVEIPTSTQVYDADTFTLEINDNAEAVFRLEDADRSARFVKFGDRDVTLTVERDFENRTEFDLFKAATAQAITISAIQSATRLIQFDIESAIHDSYAVPLSATSDLVRAQIDYRGVYNATDTRSYLIVVKTDEDLS